MPRPRIYIAGPLTAGDRLANVQTAIAVARELIRRGYAPLPPHVSHWCDPDDSLGYETWLAVDLAWVEVADAVLRLPGESKGADREEDHARKRGVPVCYGLADLCSTIRVTQEEPGNVADLSRTDGTGASKSKRSHRSIS